MVAFYCVFILMLYSKIVAGTSILNPLKRCVATSTQSSACHVCVCTTAGVYHCRAKNCDDDIPETSDGVEKECEALHTYRQNKVICNCDESGHWRSTSCRKRFQQIRPNTNLYALKIATNIPCTPKHFYITGCNICICDDSGLIDFEFCTNRRCLQSYKTDTCNSGDVLRTNNELCICSDIDYFIDRLCIKIQDAIIQEVKAEDLDKVTEVGMHWGDFTIKCKPINIYTIDCNQCFCNGNGSLICDNDICEGGKERSVVNNKASLRQMIASLPELKTPYSRCKPGNKYRYKCNTCICNNNRAPICTTMVCLEDLTLTLIDLELIS